MEAIVVFSPAFVIQAGKKAYALYFHALVLEKMSCFFEKVKYSCHRWTADNCDFILSSSVASRDLYF